MFVVALFFSGAIATPRLSFDRDAPEARGLFIAIHHPTTSVIPAKAGIQFLSYHIM